MKLNGEYLCLLLSNDHVVGEIMCSTPRPKRNFKAGGARAASGSILSGLSSDTRATFVKRANMADERRYQLRQQTKASQHTESRLNKSFSSKNKPAQQTNKNWHYWLIDASMSELFMMLFWSKAY